MATLPADNYRSAADDETWDADWQKFQSDMQRHADAADPGSPASQIGEFATVVQRALAPAEVAPAAPAPSMPVAEPDPVLQGWDELRAKRRGTDRDAIKQRWLEGTEPEESPRVGVSPLARQLEDEGWFAIREAEHAAEREQERQRAIRESSEAAAREAARYGGSGEWELYAGHGEATQRMFQGLRETPRAAGVAATQIPGGAISGVGSMLQAPDVAVSGVEHSTQAARRRWLAAMDMIDRGEIIVPPAQPGVERDRWMADAPFINGYRAGTQQQRATMRASVEAEIAAFNPTPIQERSFYRAGEAVQQYGRTVHERIGFPLPEGYDERSLSVQLGRGLGTMLAGMPVALLPGGAGVVGGATVFGAMGVGEATQRAVEFDRRERAAGRAGISQEHIILAGLLGVGPGTTDILPVEALLGRLPLPLPPAVRPALARAIARIGGQVFVEGVQEGGQEFLQNVIAREVYEPSQSLFENIPGSAALGGGVGGVAGTATEAGRGVLGAFGRRRGSSYAPAEAPAANAFAAGAICQGGRR